MSDGLGGAGGGASACTPCESSRDRSTIPFWSFFQYTLAFPIVITNGLHFIPGTAASSCPSVMSVISKTALIGVEQFPSLGIKQMGCD